MSGAVRDAFNRHPDYLTKKGRVSALTSVTKRVTGTVLSFAVHAAAESREADKASGQITMSGAEADDVQGVIRTHSPEYVSDRCYHAIRRALFPSAVRELRRDANSFKRALKAKSRQLREEMQSISNLPLEEAIAVLNRQRGAGE